MRNTKLALGLFVLSTSPLADVSLFHRLPGATGDVAIHDEAGANPAVFPPALQGIQLLEIDFVGRTELEELRTDRPRLRSDLPGASRLSLPGQGGSLYHYRRDQSLGGAVFGWMFIGTDGRARSLYELQGTGASMDVDPIIARVGVAPSGSSFLFATTLAAGGDLFDLDIPSSTATLRTPQLAPQSFSLASLFLRETWGMGASASGVYRFGRTSGAEAELVPFPGAPTWFSGEVAVSGDGLVATTAAGTDPTMAHIFTFASTGVALQVTSTPTTLFAAGYLPEYLHGPFLALNFDGTCCAFVTNSGAREAFLAEGVGPLTTSTQLLTGDATYLDTLDEIGVLFFVRDALILAVGEMGLAPGQGVENLDIYRAETTGAASLQLQNLSLSSGVPTPPFFTKSTLQPDSIRLLPGGEQLLLLNRDQGGGELFLFDTSGANPIQLLNESKTVDFIEHAANGLLFSVRRDNLAETRDLFVADLNTPTVLTTLGSLPDTISFDRAATRDDGWIAFNVSDPLGAGDYLARVNVTTHRGRLLFQVPLLFGPAITWTASGKLAFSVGQVRDDKLVFTWPVGSKFQQIADAPTKVFVLPN